MGEIKVIDFKAKIAELEDRKWEIFTKKGDLVASEEWKDINAKLEGLYRWWSKSFGADIRPYVPRRFK